MDARTLRHIPPDLELPALLPNGSQMPGEVFIIQPSPFSFGTHPEGFPLEGIIPFQPLWDTWERARNSSSPADPTPTPPSSKGGFPWWIPGISKGMQPDVSGVKPRSRFSLANGIKVPGTGAWSLPDFLVPPENREHFWLLFPTIKPAGFEPTNPKFQPSPRSKAHLPTAGNSTSGIILGNNRCQRSAAPSGTWLCRCGSSIPPIRMDFLNIQE